MFRRMLAAAVAAALSFAVAAPASANVLVRIDKSTQRMTVSVNGAPTYSWPVSTGRSGYGTPNGTFRPQRLARTWFSRKYYNSPMPHSIFYHGGYAIHGTNALRQLGGPASHGCVRLHPGNAATLFALVSRHGKGNTRIVVTGGAPTRTARQKRSRSAERASRLRQSAQPAAYAPAYRAYYGPRPYSYDPDELY